MAHVALMARRRRICANEISVGSSPITLQGKIHSLCTLILVAHPGQTYSGEIPPIAHPWQTCVAHAALEAHVGQTCVAHIAPVSQWKVALK